MKNKPMLHYTTHPTPVGELTLVASDHGLRAVVWPKSSLKRAGVGGRPQRNPDHSILKTTTMQLDEYFVGERTAFDIPLDVGQHHRADGGHDPRPAPSAPRTERTPFVSCSPATASSARTVP